MKTRVISCVVLLAITISCFVISPITRLLFFAAAAILCARELCVNLRSIGIKCADWTLYLYIAGQAAIQFFVPDTMYCAAWFAFTVYLIFFVGVVNKNISGKGALATITGLVYPCVLFSLLMAISMSERWAETLVLACLSTWVCDTFALLGGKRFGKHKLAAYVSPNKTVEGAVCGSLSAIAAGFICYFVLPLISSPLPVWACLVICFVCSVFDQIGDLAESLVKRAIGIKDFSNLIPGHGGMFDRADSLLFAIPCAYFCLQLLRF